MCPHWQIVGLSVGSGDLQGTLPTSLRAKLGLDYGGGVDYWGRGRSNSLSSPKLGPSAFQVLCPRVPTWRVAVKRQSPVVMMQGSMDGQPPLQGTSPHTHIVNLWLRHGDPLVDSQGCVAHSHPLLLPAEDKEEPVTRGTLGVDPCSRWWGAQATRPWSSWDTVTTPGRAERTSPDHTDTGLNPSTGCPLPSQASHFTSQSLSLPIC